MYGGKKVNMAKGKESFVRKRVEGGGDISSFPLNAVETKQLL